MPSQRSPFTVRISEEHENALTRILRKRGISKREWITEKIVQESGYRPPKVTLDREEVEEILDTLRAMKNESRYIIPEEKPKRGARGKKDITNAFIDNLEF